MFSSEYFWNYIVERYAIEAIIRRIKKHSFYIIPYIITNFKENEFHLYIPLSIPLISLKRYNKK